MAGASLSHEGLVPSAVCASTFWQPGVLSMNPWMLLAVVLALVGAYAAGDWRGSHNTQVRMENDLKTQQLAATKQARETSEAWQEALNARIAYDHSRIAAVDARLSAATDELRKRPERSSNVPDNPRPTCTGANGAELGASHAIFLARFAASAAKQDGALASCYALIDALKGRALKPPGDP